MELAGNGLVAFGGVWIVDYLLSKYTKVALDTQMKLLLMGALYLGLSYMPQSFTLDFANRVKEAIGVVTAVTALYQGGKGIKKA